jgi:hypothetical protein
MFRFLVGFILGIAAGYALATAIAQQQQHEPEPDESPT